MAGARDWYIDGVADHYREHGSSYRNPHAAIVDSCVGHALERWTIDCHAVLDLAAGSGEFTRAVLKANPRAACFGCDPFTFEAYERDTGTPCERVTFEAIAAGGFRGRRFSLIACSFAMHLCQTSVLPQLAVELAQIAPRLLILTPHKRPILRNAWGWSPVGEFVRERVRTRLYASTLVADTLDLIP